VTRPGRHPRAQGSGCICVGWEMTGAEIKDVHLAEMHSIDEELSRILETCNKLPGFSGTRFLSAGLSRMSTGRRVGPRPRFASVRAPKSTKLKHTVGTGRVTEAILTSGLHCDKTRISKQQGEQGGVILRFFGPRPCACLSPLRPSTSPARSGLSERRSLEDFCRSRAMRKASVDGGGQTRGNGVTT